jgi:hypothetical protein
MTLRRLNLRIQGFPESYASEPYGEDMVFGEPHPPLPMTVHSPRAPGPHDVMMNVSTDSVGSHGHPSHDPVVGVLGSPIRRPPAIADDPITGSA